MRADDLRLCRQLRHNARAHWHTHAENAVTRVQQTCDWFKPVRTPLRATQPVGQEKASRAAYDGSALRGCECPNLPPSVLRGNAGPCRAGGQVACQLGGARVAAASADAIAVAAGDNSGCVRTPAQVHC